MILELGLELELRLGLGLGLDSLYKINLTIFRNDQ